MGTSSMPALALLLLADGRFPAGGHAHSAGVEAAVASRRVVDEASLEAFVLGRLVSTGLVDAAFAAATTERLSTVRSPAESVAVLHLLDEEAEARIAPLASRDASRRLGRQLARAASRCWPAGVLAVLASAFPGGAHQSVAAGCVAVAVGATPRQVAELIVHHAMTAPAQAGVRLLGLDPYGVAALVAAPRDHGGECDRHRRRGGVRTTCGSARRCPSCARHRRDRSRHLDRPPVRNLKHHQPEET